MEKVSRAVNHRYAPLLRACGSSQECHRLHQQILETTGGLIDTYLANLLIQAYSRWGAVGRAKQLFDGMGQLRDCVSWDVMLTAYAQNGHSHEALALFKKMEAPCVGNFRTVFWMCSKLSNLQEGRRLQCEFVSNGMAYDLSAGNGLLSLYAKCEEPQYAREVFDAMAVRDTTSWNSIITVHASSGLLEQALNLQRRADLEGVITDAVSFSYMLGQCTSLKTGRSIHLRAALGGLVKFNAILQTGIVNMYAKCGSLKDAREAFDATLYKDVPAWNAIILIYAKLGHGGEALSLFRTMSLEGFRPDATSFIGGLTASTVLGDLASGRSIHATSRECERDNILLSNSVINMYAKCATSMDEAAEVFQAMVQKSVSTWNVMVAGYTQQGHCEKAVLLLREMDLEGAKADRISYLSLVTACAGAGSLAQSRALYARVMASCSTVNTVLENAFVNMFAKCGNLQLARSKFEGMSHWDEGSWNVIISAYALHGRAMEALELFHRMQLHGESLTPVTLTVVLLACSHAGLEEEAWFHFGETAALYGLCRTQEHYHCMVDILGRAGKLNEAQSFMHGMPYEAGSKAWLGLLGSCKIHGNATLGALAFGKIAGSSEKACESAPYALYSSFGGK